MRTAEENLDKIIKNIRYHSIKKFLSHVIWSLVYNMLTADKLAISKILILQIQSLLIN